MYESGMAVMVVIMVSALPLEMKVCCLCICSLTFTAWAGFKTFVISLSVGSDSQDQMIQAPTMKIKRRESNLSFPVNMD